MEIEKIIEENVKTSKNLSGWTFECPLCKEKFHSLSYEQIKHNSKVHLSLKHG